MHWLPHVPGVVRDPTRDTTPASAWPLASAGRACPGGLVPGASGTRSCRLCPQFQTELRKILVSLIEVARKLLALSPDAVELFKKANGRSGHAGAVGWAPTWALGPHVPAAAHSHAG